MPLIMGNFVAKGIFLFFLSSFSSNLMGQASLSACSDKSNPCSEDELISLNFQEVELRRVLQVIARLAKANLIVSDAVDGKITLNLEGVYWQDAIGLILRSKGLAQYTDGGVIVIGTQEEIARQQQGEIEHIKRSAELQPLHTRHIPVLHAVASEVVALLKKPDSKTSGVLSNRGSLLVDERTNTIILIDTADRLALSEQIIKQVDIPVKQVLIEAKIVTANVSFSRQLGVRWGAASADGGGRNRPSFAGSRGGLAGLRQGNLNYHTNPLNVDLGVASSRSGRFAIGLITGGFMLDLELSALASEGNGEVVARPKIVTADKQSATISSGVEIPFQEVSASGATATSFKQATMMLKVKPHITPDGRIAMSLQVSQDSLGEMVNGIPLINTNQLSTQVLVKDGETVVLGGVYRTMKTRSVVKTPLLGDIPLIGLLFRHTNHTENKQELLIFITPQIIKDDAPEWSE